MKQNIVLFSGAKKPLHFREMVSELENIGASLDISKYNLWYGGGQEGLMPVIPRAFHERGGSVFSVDWIQFVNQFGSAEFANNMILETFEERQKILITKGDVYLCLPGGVGTLSELCDVLVHNDVQKQNKTIILFSHGHFFQKIYEFLLEKAKEGFIKPSLLENVMLFTTAEEVIQFFNHE